MIRATGYIHFPFNAIVVYAMALPLVFAFDIIRGLLVVMLHDLLSAVV